ncbi:uncharacterized protein LOC118428867 [Branchiostoma floridae]|uniref:Uncharacterized protein LOC118428867 n=1 Tax=Branchiostoma floridae TaxID=7739 RepID=C3YCB6_BRAFL|nr:uncharacterized protein LOC118428867 [Branchiostoma floridae]|eukprot:XP_002606138.1 hypothetical protein BRAFLDRAFT_125125 [Branchiostoma floridae]
MASKRVAVHTEQQKAVSAAPKKKKPSPPKVTKKCSCKGDCGSRRCGCVLKGVACGDSCNCTGCINPFNILQKYNVDCAAAAQDRCLMDNIFKVTDLRGRLEERHLFYCCEVSAQLKDMIPGHVKCPTPGCLIASRFSWCRNQPFQDACRGMKHCEKCRECVDEGDRHCDDCNTCYFEGMSCFQCPCKGPDDTGLYPDHVGLLHPAEAIMIAQEMLAELRGGDYKDDEESDLSDLEDTSEDSDSSEDD